MKKILSVALALTLLIALLVACDRTTQPQTEVEVETEVEGEVPPCYAGNPWMDGSRDQEYDDVNEDTDVPVRAVVDLNISIASDALLSSFDYLHEVDYRDLYISGTDGAEARRVRGDRLVIWADIPLYDFALISITNDVVDDEIVFIPTGYTGMVETLLPGQAFVINDYFGAGTLPASGVSFSDENGERYYFWMQADQSVHAYPNPFNDAGFLDLFEDGALEIEVQRDGRESRFFTVTLDEIGDADPTDWFMENRHLWHLFFMMEFEVTAE